jgi:hypothetical protein
LDQSTIGIKLFLKSLMMKLFTLFIVFVFSLSANVYSNIELKHLSSKSDTLPYHQIPDYPDSYSSENVVARMIDGFGYRYYWASEGLRPEDLSYMPSDDGRSTRETLEHIFYLSRSVYSTCAGLVSARDTSAVTMTYDSLRMRTLQNIENASLLLKQNGDLSLEALKMRFQRGDKLAEYEFWHLLNGPLADAIYHVGQIVSYRRSSGNPLNPGVNVFTGKTRE